MREGGERDRRTGEKKENEMEYILECECALFSNAHCIFTCTFIANSLRSRVTIFRTGSALKWDR